MSAGSLSPARLARVRHVLERHVDAGEAPGAVAVVARRGEVHVEAVGTLAFDGANAATPMSADTICRMTSLTKPIVAACAMTLIEDGTLRLDDAVDELLPELAHRAVLVRPDGPLHDTVPAHRPITVRDLLTFTLGIGTQAAEPGTVPISDAVAALGEPSPDEWIRRLGALPLAHQPGDAWMYEFGADVTGVLIARATGMTFGDALRRRILDPLGMTDTAFSVENHKLHRLATAYVRDDTTRAVVVNDDDRWLRPPAFEAGGGGLVSTANDYLAFASALLAGGTLHGQRVLSPESVTLMTSDHLTAAQKMRSGLWPGFFDDIGWGFGMAVRTCNSDLGPSIGSYGWHGLYGTTWYNDPAEQLIALLMIQRTSVPQWRADFWAAAYQAIDD